MGPPLLGFLAEKVSGEESDPASEEEDRDDEPEEEVKSSSSSRQMERLLEESDMERADDGVVTMEEDAEEMEAERVERELDVTGALGSEVVVGFCGDPRCSDGVACCRSDDATAEDAWTDSGPGNEPVESTADSASELFSSKDSLGPFDRLIEFQALALNCANLASSSAFAALLSSFNAFRLFFSALTFAFVASSMTSPSWPSWLSFSSFCSLAFLAWSALSFCSALRRLAASSLTFLASWKDFFRSSASF